MAKKQQTKTFFLKGKLYPEITMAEYNKIMGIKKEEPKKEAKPD